MYIFSQVHFYISVEGRVCYCIWWYLKRASTPEPRFTSFPRSSQHYGFEKLSLNCICWCWLKSRPTNIWLISDLTVDRTIKWNSLLWSEWFQNICSFDTLHLSSAMALHSPLVWDLENLKKKKGKFLIMIQYLLIEHLSCASSWKKSHSLFLDDPILFPF